MFDPGRVRGDMRMKGDWGSPLDTFKMVLRTSVPTYNDQISYSPAPKVDRLPSDSERLGYS